MPAAPEQSTAIRRPNWRQWVIIANILVGLALIAFLKSSHGPWVVVSTVGETQVYRPSTWTLALSVVPIACFLALGLVIVTIRHLLGRLIGGLVLLVTAWTAVVIPATVRQPGLTITPDEFTERHGFWYQPVTNTVRFDSLAGLAVHAHPKSDGPPDLELQCRRRDGQVVRMPLGDDLRAGLNVIRERALRHGVRMPRGVVLDTHRGVTSARPKAWTGGVVWALELLVITGGVYWVLRQQRRQPANRMARCLAADDPVRAIEIGEARPPALRDFATRCNLVVAYTKVGRHADARTVLAEIETAGPDRRTVTEEQFRETLDRLCELVAQADRDPVNADPEGLPDGSPS